MIEPEVREAAVVGLLQLASRRFTGCDRGPHCPLDFHDVLGDPANLEDQATQLALEAFSAVPTHNVSGVFIEWEAQYAEAALLLEDGWSPGEPLPP